MVFRNSKELDRSHGGAQIMLTLFCSATFPFYLKVYYIESWNRSYTVQGKILTNNWKIKLLSSFWRSKLKQKPVYFIFQQDSASAPQPEEPTLSHRPWCHSAQLSNSPDRTNSCCQEKPDPMMQITLGHIKAVQASIPSVQRHSRITSIHATMNWHRHLCRRGAKEMTMVLSFVLKTSFWSVSSDILLLWKLKFYYFYYP